MIHTQKSGYNICQLCDLNFVNLCQQKGYRYRNILKYIGYWLHGFILNVLTYTLRPMLVAFALEFAAMQVAEK